MKVPGEESTLPFKSGNRKRVVIVSVVTAVIVIFGAVYVFMTTYALDRLLPINHLTALNLGEIEEFRNAKTLMLVVVARDDDRQQISHLEKITKALLSEIRLRKDHGGDPDLTLTIRDQSGMAAVGDRAHVKMWTRGHITLASRQGSTLRRYYDVEERTDPVTFLNDATNGKLPMEYWESSFATHLMDVLVSAFGRRFVADVAAHRGNDEVLKYCAPYARQLMDYLERTNGEEPAAVSFYDRGRLSADASNEEDEFRWMLESAGLGYPPAQNRIGVMYSGGEGVKRDKAEAVSWYRKAADNGLAVAQENLASCYLRGSGTGQDSLAAVHWYARAGKQGSMDAQIALARLYLDGNTGIRDTNQALEWLHLAADQGSLDSQYELATIYYQNGRIADGDSMAAHWFHGRVEKAFDRECAFALLSGRKCDDSTTIQSFKARAERGESEAQFYTGVMGFAGDFVEMDKTTARAWLQKSADQGLEEAQAVLTDLVRP